MTDFVNVGDEVKVKVILIDDTGRIKLSRKEAMKELGESDPEPVGTPGGGEGGQGGGGGGYRDDRGPRGGGDRPRGGWWRGSRPWPAWPKTRLNRRSRCTM